MFERATEELYENIYELDITHNRPANRSTEQYLKFGRTSRYSF